MLRAQSHKTTLTSDAIHKLQISRLLTACLTWLQIRDCYYSLNSFINIPRMAHRTQEKHLLTVANILKDTNSRWRVAQGKLCGTGLQVAMPSSGAPPSQHLHVFTSPEAVWTPSFWMFIEAVLHRHDWWNNWPLVINSTSSPLFLASAWKSRSGAEILTLWSCGWFPWQPAHFYRVFHKVTSLI